MDDCTHRVERRNNQDGYPVCWTLDQDGRQRLSTEAEVALWDALQSAREQVQRLQPKKGK
jgi:hypothetical protein